MRNVRTFWIYVILAAGVLMAWAPSVEAQVAAPGAGSKPGLAVCYMYRLVRSVDDIAVFEKSIKCEPGPPLASLDFYGGDGKVLTSTAADGVMAKITGLIHLNKTGAYKFAFESNDGVRLKIDGKLIVEDPGVHDDRFSDVGTMEVAKPGWYPLTIEFFERRFTWTLRFLWKPPGVEGDFDPVPAEVFAH